MLNKRIYVTGCPIYRALQMFNALKIGDLNV
jgi:hypothetical protein